MNLQTRIAASRKGARSRKRMHKFGAVATVVDGIRFPSKFEASRYTELKLLERAKEITGLQLQVTYPLHVNGEKLGSYIADFKYFDVQAQRERVEDAKGFDTPMSHWKRKHVKAQYGVEIEIVRKS